MNSQQYNLNRQTLPIVMSGLANFFLGASSLYWRELSEVPPTTLVAYRIILSAAIITPFILLFRHSTRMSIFKPKTLILHSTASIFLAANWGAFIWSSINGQLLASGIGYLLAPFISVTLGVALYSEEIKKTEIVSICIALTSITFLIILTENLNHWIYLSISLTWGAYTYLKKASHLDAVNGTFIETLFLTACLTLTLWLFDFTISPPDKLTSQSTRLIWLSGAVSITPLVLFSFATGKIPLTLTGLLQFILPLTLITISLITSKLQFPRTTLTILIISIITLITFIAYDSITKKANTK